MLDLEENQWKKNFTVKTIEKYKPQKIFFKVQFRTDRDSIRFSVVFTSAGAHRLGHVT
jgi:hypothetical protein